MKKILCLILSLVMALSMISVSAFAEGEAYGDVKDPLMTEVLNCFFKYLKEHNVGEYDAAISGDLIEYDKYVVFFGDYGGPGQEIKISRVVDNYLITNDCKGVPYDLGVYVYDGVDICTLEEAIDRKYFKMSDIGPFSNKFEKVYDVDTETVTELFTAYLDKWKDQYEEVTCKLIGQYGKYVIFYGGTGVVASGSTSDIIDSYVVINDCMESPYGIGVYVYDGKDVCMLHEAVYNKYFRMAEVAHLLDNTYLVYDVNFDNVIDLMDVVKLQRIAAELIHEDMEYFEHIVISNDGYMDKAVRIQLYVAKIITELP